MDEIQEMFRLSMSFHLRKTTSILTNDWQHWQPKKILTNGPEFLGVSYLQTSIIIPRLQNDDPMLVSLYASVTWTTSKHFQQLCQIFFALRAGIGDLEFLWHATFLRLTLQRLQRSTATHENVAPPVNLNRKGDWNYRNLNTNEYLISLSAMWEWPRDVLHICGWGSQNGLCPWRWELSA